MTQYVIKRERAAISPQLDLGALNEEQRSVVVAGDGPILVIAGAGSGKTRTLIYRAAYLINRGIDPRHLLLCTFTNRAAYQMLRRLETLSKVELKSLWAGTFHHIANKALRRYGHLCGLPENYGILDREDARDLLASCIAEEGARLRARRYPTPAILLKIASLAVNCQQPLEHVLSEHAPRFADMTEDVGRVLDRFAQRKLKLGLVDYDDLLFIFKMLLTEQPTALQEISGRFRHVLVDEYQDTNHIQGEIVDLCATTHGNLMVVGDDAQSIYGFRGAHFANIYGFSDRYPSAKVYKLQQNYRSTPEILALANRCIARNVRQVPKTLAAVRGHGTKPALIPLGDVYQQADFVSQRVLELTQEHDIPLSRMAVLYRAHAHSIELQVELTRRNIPFIVRSGLRFFEHAHIKDLVGYLRVLHNGSDEIAWRRVLRMWSGVGKASQDRVVELMLNRRESSPLLAGEALMAALPEVRRLPATGRSALERLAQLLTRAHRTGKPAEMIGKIVGEHYKDYAQTVFPNSQTRIDDLHQFAAFADHYASLESLLSDLALVSGVAAEAPKAGEPEDEQLTLSTVHQAKGLEWKVVFLLSLSDGCFPQARALRTDEELEEERRLFYVAVTRTMDDSYLCYPRFGETPDGFRRLLRASRFLAELESSPPLYDEWQIEETT